MPSRKRNLGKTRKALKEKTKKEALVREQLEDELRATREKIKTIPNSGALLEQASFFSKLKEKRAKRQLACHHGCSLHSSEYSSPFSPVHQFRTSVEMMVGQKLATGSTLIESLIESFRRVKAVCEVDIDDDRSVRTAIKSFYVALGVSSLLCWNDGDLEQQNLEHLFCLYTSGVIIYLESYDEGLSPPPEDDEGSSAVIKDEWAHKARCIRLKMRLDDVLGGGERAAVRFFSKLVKKSNVVNNWPSWASCSCLVERQKQLKSHPKTSICSTCDIICRTTCLKRCGVCNVVQYCSRQCQRADWSLHRNHCVLLSSIMKKSTEAKQSESSEAAVLESSAPVVNAASPSPSQTISVLPSEDTYSPIVIEG